MKNCLCCEKQLRSGEEQLAWHKSCIKRFFGTSVIPEIEIDEKALELLATENTKNFSFHTRIYVPFPIFLIKSSCSHWFKILWSCLELQ